MSLSSRGAFCEISRATQADHFSIGNILSLPKTRSLVYKTPSVSWTSMTRATSTRRPRSRRRRRARDNRTMWSDRLSRRWSWIPRGELNWTITLEYVTIASGNLCGLPHKALRAGYLASRLPLPQTRKAFWPIKTTGATAIRTLLCDEPLFTA